MAADLSVLDPKSLWQDQEREADPVTLEQIHALVRRYDSRIRWSGVTLALGLVAVGAAVSAAWTRAHDPVTTVLVSGGELTTFYLIFRLVFPVRDPAEPAGAYLRRRLQLRLRHLQGGWVWALLPLLPAILWRVYVVSRHTQSLPARLAQFAIVGLALIFMAIRTRLRARKVKAQLDELDGLLER
jgi:hypothetical protein